MGCCNTKAVDDLSHRENPIADPSNPVAVQLGGDAAEGDVAETVTADLENIKRCSACLQSFDGSHFSKRQWELVDGNRRCTECNTLNKSSADSTVSSDPPPNQTEQKSSSTSTTTETSTEPGSQSSPDPDDAASPTKRKGKKGGKKEKLAITDEMRADWEVKRKAKESERAKIQAAVADAVKNAPTGTGLPEISGVAPPPGSKPGRTRGPSVPDGAPQVISFVPPLQRHFSFALDDIHYACRSGNLEKVKYYLEREPLLLTSLDDYGNTPIYWASLCGHPEVVRFLMSKGATDDEVKRCYINALDQDTKDALDGKPRREHDQVCQGANEDNAARTASNGTDADSDEIISYAGFGAMFDDGI